MTKPIYLFISPHLDDAILSCGGYLRRLTNAGEHVIVATVVTADVPKGTPISWVAQRNHNAWRLYDAPFAVRTREDIAALGALGVKHAHLGLIDAMYRRDVKGQPLYIKNTVRVPVHPDDWRNYALVIREKIHELLCAYAGQPAKIFCPSTIGDHVDHILIRHAVEMYSDPKTITYYEDYPYANQPNAIQAHLNSDGNRYAWQSMTIALTPEEIEARITAIALYTSQIAGLFPSPKERWLEVARTRLPFIAKYLDFPIDQVALHERMVTCLKTYIAQVGGERYWQRTSNN